MYEDQYNFNFNFSQIHKHKICGQLSTAMVAETEPNALLSSITTVYFLPLYKGMSCDTEITKIFI